MKIASMTPLHQFVQGQDTVSAQGGPLELSMDDLHRVAGGKSPEAAGFIVTEQAYFVDGFILSE